MHLQEGQDQQRFSDALNAAKASNDHGAYVDAQSVEQLTEKGAKLIVSEDGLAGAAVATTGKEKGNIFAVFKDAKSTARGASAELLIQAIAEGGNKLDCYAGKLAAMYAKIGMEPVARVAFNEEFMPDGWNTARDDHPDIIFWKHNGDSADTVAQKYGLGESEGGYHVYTTEELNSLPLFDDVTDANGETQYGYDRAWDYRDSLIDAEVMQNETAGQGNDQSVQASYGVPGVTSTGKSGTAGAVVSPIVKLAKALGVGMTLGTRKMDTGSTKIPKAVRGYYEQNAKYIAVRSNEASSYAVTMHEAGHAIADKIGLTGTQEMVDRLNPVFAKNYNAQQLPGEAFAEFVSLYMRDSRMAEDFAGSDFMRTFEASLRRADIDKAVHQARDQIQAYSAATTLDRAKAGIIDQATVVMICGAVVGTAVGGGSVVCGAVGAVLSGTVVAVVAGGVAGNGAVILIVAILTVVVLAVAAAGGQGKHQEQGGQQERQTSFHVVSSFARVFASAIPESYCARIHFRNS